MADLKRGDKVLIFSESIKGKIVTVDRKYSNITGYYELTYTVNVEGHSYMYYYCSENNLIPLTNNKLLSVLYGLENEE